MSGDEPALAMIDPTLSQRRTVFALSLLMVCGCIITLPLSAAHLPRFDAFVVIANTALALLSLLVAILMFTQLTLVRSVALLVLACGFLFVGLTTLPQLVRLADGMSVDPALRYLRDLSLPAAVIVYSSLGRRFTRSIFRVRPLLMRGATATFAIAALAVWLAAYTADPVAGVPAGDNWRMAASATLAITIAGALLMMWRRRQSTLNLWLQVTLTAWLIAVLLEALAPDGASFAWDLAQFYAVLGIGCMMLWMLTENAGLFARISALMAARDRTRNEVRGGPPINAAIEAIADELNQPLCAISANVEAVAQLIEKQPLDLREIRAALLDIGNDAHRASDTMRSAQRLLAGAQERPTVVDVGQLLTECLGHMRTEMLLHRVTCEVETAAHLPAIRGFRQQLLQLLTNLVTNSLEAMSSMQTGERRLTVRASRHDARAVAIWIEDSGAGVNPENVARIFDPFFTTKPHRSGLGLAICRTIAAMHGGHISLSRRDGSGAAFRVVLPAGS